MSLRDKVILVTAAGSGIGRASAIICAAQGAMVVVTDRDVNSGQSVVREITHAGGVAAFTPLDVQEREQVDASVAFAVASFGRIDGAVNNAGAPQPFTKFLDATEEAYRRIMAVNVEGTWMCMRAQIAQMKRQGAGGSIVNIASTAGMKGAGLMAIYSASKHAVVGLSKSAAQEFARTGPRINVVCPGVTETPMMQSVAADERAHRAFLSAQPTGRFAAPQEIGAAVAWLLSDAASYVTGVVMPVDGGMTS